jgi:hypothetical protein
MMDDLIYFVVYSILYVIKIANGLITKIYFFYLKCDIKNLWCHYTMI